MRCPNCQFKNPEGMNFCGKCGTPLPKICRACGFENPPDFRICGKCGQPLEESSSLPAYARRAPLDYTPPFLVEKVLKSRHSLEGERKLVTVLFADVANFTGIAEKLDPEDVHDIMDGCFEILGKEIHGAGGTINQYTGDGVMALFGAPVALEDHVERACYAALRAQRSLEQYRARLKRQYGIDFRMRMGLNTGPVVVGAIGDNLRLDYTAVGDTTNLAARLQALAKPGQILVSERVYKAAKKSFQFRKLGYIRVKGKERGVLAYILEGELKQPLQTQEQLEKIPFVNRRKELDELKAAFTKCKRGNPFVVALTGEVGIGKTRLVKEFIDSVKEARVFWGACKPYGLTTILHPMIDMLYNYFGLGAQAGDSGATEAITTRLEDKALYSKVSTLLRLLEEIRHSDQTAHQASMGNKREIFRILRELVLTAASDRPLLAVIDNVQWMDTTSQEFMEYLFQFLNGIPVMVICAGRSRPGQWCRLAQYLEMDLGPLNPEDSKKLLDLVIGTQLLDEQVSRKIISNSGGNPLFLIEMGNTLVTRKLIKCDETKCTLTIPIEKIAIPDSIRGVMAARLDSLPEDLKWLVQLASVIGMDFDQEVLKAVSGQSELDNAISRLVEEGIFEKVRDGSGGAYRFRHLMMREVAYHSLLRRDRRRLHELTARAIEKIYSDSLYLHAESLSRHYYAAGNWEKALRYTFMAAEQAQKAFACHEALIFLDRALEVISYLPHEKMAAHLIDLHNKRGILLYCVGRMKEALNSFEEMLALAKELKDKKAEAKALFRQGWIYFYLHHPKKSESKLKHSIELSLSINDTETFVMASSFLGFLYAVLGKLDLAEPHLLKAREMSRMLEDTEVKAWAIAYLIQYYNWTAQFREGLKLCQELRLLNDKIKSPNFNILLCFREGLIYGALGLLDKAEESLTTGLKQLETGDDKFWRPRFLNTLGWIKSEGGEIQEALKLNKEALETALAVGDPESIHNSRINLAENYMETGKLSEAEQELHKTLEHVRKPGLYYTRWRYRTRLFIALAELYRKMGDLDQALTFANKALRHSRKTRAKKHEIRALMVKGLIQLDKGKPTGIKFLEKAYALAQSVEARILVEKTARLLDKYRRNCKGHD